MPELKFLFVTLGMIAGIVIGVIYLIAPDREAQRAWVDRCNKAGGIAVPTERHQVKGTTHYSDWVCIKAEVIEVPL